MSTSDELAAALGHAAETLDVQRDLPTTLQSIVDAAAVSLPGIDHAGITIAHRDGRMETRAFSDELVLRLDALQYEYGEGPCVYAVDAETVVTVNNIRHEQRWPAFVPRAVACGLKAQMGLLLHIDHQKIGGLNLYSTQTEVIDPDAQHLAELFAAHAALALGFMRRDEELNTALAHRKTIGQAIGIVMERFGIDEDQAFGYLRRVSSTTNVKLRDVAAELVRRTPEGHVAGRSQPRSRVLRRDAAERAPLSRRESEGDRA
jgi:GAF domain-containing protein